MFGIGALQPIHLCLGGMLCSPVFVALVVVAVVSLRRQRA